MSSPSTPDTREPYYSQTTGTWHPVAQLPISEPKVSWITVRVYELEEWEDAWYEAHWGHAEGGEGVEWASSEHNDEDEDYGMRDEHTEVQLLKCCGIAWPRGKNVSLVVKPAVDGEEEFVTVHDYLTAVHPWLMGFRGEILAAKGMLNWDDEPLGEETELMLNSNGLEILMINTRPLWISHTTGEAVSCISVPVNSGK